MRRDNEISFRSELLRKGIHLISLSIPIGYYHLPRATALTVLVPLMVASIVMDVARYTVPAFGRYFDRWFAHMLREHERDPKRRLLNGATYVLASAVICVQLFPKIVAVTAFGILIISDASAALIGRRYGRRPFFQKSLEGALAFFFTALVVVAVVPKLADPPIELAVGTVAAAVGAVIEAASIWLRFDDNLSIPLSIGGTMWLLYYLLAVVDPTRFASLYQAVVTFQ